MPSGVYNHPRKPIDFIVDGNGCFICTSHYHIKQGYCRMRNNDTGHILIHRFIYQECFEEIPDGLDVLHKCDNPPCINPEHLFLGTHLDNMRDKVNKGRSNCMPGEIHPMAKLTEKDVINIRKDNRTHAEIAKSYNVAFSNISMIKRYKTWKHI